MKSFLIIGMGTFGHHLCRALCKMKCEVMIADQNGEALEDMLPYVAAAKICDCANIEVLRSFGVQNFDACFVCVNKNFQACLEITDQLKELGAKRVYSKADRDLEAKFLMRCGADFIIYPERDAAERIAVHLRLHRPLRGLRHLRDRRTGRVGRPLRRRGRAAQPPRPQPHSREARREAPPRTRPCLCLREGRTRPRAGQPRRYTQSHQGMSFPRKAERIC